MLADRVSQAVGKGFNIPPPPSVSIRVFGSSEIAFSHFKSVELQQGLSVPSPRDEAFVFNVPLASARYSVVSIDGLRQSVVQDPGKAYLFDLTSKNEVSLDTAYDSIRIHLPQSTIDGMAFEKGLPRVGGLWSRQLGQEDRTLYLIAQMVLPTILGSVQLTTAFMEYVALAVHDHVINTYSGMQKAERVSGGLTPWQARRTFDFIEANLSNDPSIAVLSQECGISASYFARAFRTTLGMAPHQWITRRRVERAKSLMAESKESLADISAACGFVDQSHFGRHFLKLEGTSPAQWRRRRVGG
ncbi:AraC family transcriptional regulator [Rhizobium calliandrae]|uniref:AraC family transcriptional regulator n=1 Tax=Rhizobium calliandrae TaxID=1312182 RepID=A0ABT7KHN4_9HYPH|nr:AraC family transcriptional regulator [Rhizobium calliandrae]MDL2406823.1 AraC family transcriptional regulator [Rhizobium calliandrae]